jgi:hypothetical protein
MRDGKDLDMYIGGGIAARERARDRGQRGERERQREGREIDRGKREQTCISH